MCRGIKQLAVGGSHICAIIDDGTVRCWSYNDKGQLGDGSQVSRPTPGPAISGLTDVVQMNAGYEHTCAVTRAGSVWCWGHNYYGQLGFTGETTIPVQVQNLGGPVEEVGCHGISEYLTGHTCARLRTGRVQCWGSNLHGELGNGTHDGSTTPVEVLNLTDAVQIAVTEFAACAVKSTRKVVCWGYNGEGRLATGSAEQFVTAPEEVLGLSDVHMVDGAEGYFCAVAGADRRVKCWGADLGGVLGDGPANNGRVSSTVVDTNVGLAAEVRTGWRSTCMRWLNGDVACWGQNRYGQFGNGNTTDTDSLATRTLLASPSVSLASRWGFSCALLNTGRAQCWGGNPLIGNGKTADFWSTPEYVVW